MFALPPVDPIFKLAKERGYLAAGPGPAGTCALIKQVAAVPGDRVTIKVMQDFAEQLHLDRYTLFMQDYGGPPVSHGFGSP